VRTDFGSHPSRTYLEGNARPSSKEGVQDRHPAGRADALDHAADDADGPHARLREEATTRASARGDTVLAMLEPAFELMATVRRGFNVNAVPTVAMDEQRQHRVGISLRAARDSQVTRRSSLRLACLVTGDS
jgi:hypothetical protein